MIDFKTNNKPILSWCNDPYDTTLMPDTPCGYGMPIGGAIACHSVMIPNTVGVDIGYGMSCFLY